MDDVNNKPLNAEAPMFKVASVDQSTVIKLDDRSRFQPRQIKSDLADKNEEQKSNEIETRDASQTVLMSADNSVMYNYSPNSPVMSDFIAQFSNMNTNIPYDLMYLSPSAHNSTYSNYSYNPTTIINPRIPCVNKPIFSNAVPNTYIPIISYPRVNHPQMVQVPYLLPGTVPNISPANRSRRNSCLKDKVFNTGDKKIDKNLTDLYKRVNPRSEFSLDVSNSCFYVIKSYTEDHVHRSIKYGQWCSTQRGNDILNNAYTSVQSQNGHVYLFFSVNGSGYFCGIAEMTSPFDHDNKSAHWNDDKWAGGFSVEWLYVKDVPNKYLKHIILEYNDNRPITNSRDATEIKPSTKGYEALRIIHEYHHNSSLFDDFDFYESREKDVNAAT